MEHKRRRFFKTVTERRERLERIAASSPPASTIEGQVQRLRDRRAEERGEPAPGTVVEDEDEVEASEPDEDAQVAAAVLERPQPRRRGRPLSLKPSHRQPLPPSDTRGESWWTKPLSREEFQDAARAERDRLKKSRVHVPERMLNE